MKKRNWKIIIEVIDLTEDGELEYSKDDFNSYIKDELNDVLEDWSLKILNYNVEEVKNERNNKV